MIRHVVLSDGTRATVGLSPSSWTQYYPDLPHCAVCDRSATEAQLYVCDAVVRGKITGRCGCYLCDAHRLTDTGKDLCPMHEKE